MIKNFRLFFGIISEVIYVLDSKQKKKFVGSLVFVFFCSVLELLGVSAILPFVQAIIAPDKLMENEYITRICDYLNIHNYNSLLVLVGTLIILIYLFKNAFIIYATYYQTDFLTSMQKNLSVRMLNSYLKRPYSYFLNTNSSVIRTGCSTSIVSFRDTLSSFLILTTEILTTILIGSYLLLTDFITAVGSLLLVGAILLGMMLLFKPAVKKTGTIAKETDIERSKCISQAVEGIKDIQVTQRADFFVNAFDKAADRARVGTRTYTVLSNCPNRITEGICVGGIIGVVCFRLVTGDESMAYFVPKLASFAMAAFKILPSVGKIANSVTGIVYCRPLASLVYENIRDVEKYDEAALLQLADSRDELKAGIDGFALLSKIKNNSFIVEMDDIVWQYENSEKAVLTGLDLKIYKGESIGLIGASGAGKSTITDILLGLLKPQKGTVQIDGYDIYSIPNTWSQMIGYVPQSIYLLDDTIRANIAFGMNEISDEKVWKALERARLKEFVEKLPQGIYTMVGERGVKFSGGQRQRLAIARALYYEPEILVLDEATSALDNDTEKAVLESIESLQGSMTLVIVAHRLTTIRKCDKIYEIKDGIAVERIKSEIN